MIERVHVIDSHTGGEPTRVVIAGGPDLGMGTAGDKLELFQNIQDRFRSAVVNEPRGSDILVGALLLEPVVPTSAAGVIFFNNAGFLGMCGHGTIGVMTTLAHIGRIRPGTHLLETPVGVVETTLHESGDVSVHNVPAFRQARGITVDVEGHGPVTGDVAWGGNWFFLVSDHGQDLSLSNVGRLTDFTLRIRAALERNSITGSGGAVIDHIELFSPPERPDADSRNFVLCPGAAYDRSACGTGTSAKMACLYADGKLQPGQTWRQESITGTLFQGTVRIVNGKLIPTIRGRAYVTAEATLLLNSEDPCCWGAR